VIVVAQHRRQNVQKIGISMTIISAKRLQEGDVRNVKGLEYEAPNLQVKSQFGTGHTSFAIRGVGTDFNDYASNNAPGCGMARRCGRWRMSSSLSPQGNVSG